MKNTPITIDFCNGEVWATTLDKANECRRKHYARIRHKKLSDFKIEPLDSVLMFHWIRNSANLNDLINDGGLIKIHNFEEFCKFKSFCHNHYTLTTW